MATAATASGGEAGPSHHRKSCLLAKNRPWRRRSLGGTGGGRGGIQFAPLPSTRDVTVDESEELYPQQGELLVAWRAGPPEREPSARLKRVGRNRKLLTSRAASIALGGDALVRDKLSQKDTYFSDCFEAPPPETSSSSSSDRRRHSAWSAHTGTTGSTSLTSSAAAGGPPGGSHHPLVRTSAKGGKRHSLQPNSLETICSAVRLELKKEELEDSFRTMLIKRGIQKSRARMRVGGKLTPYEVDAERRRPAVFRYNKDASGKKFFKSSSHTLSTSSGCGEGLTMEEQIWNCIETLLADAFSADESVPKSFSTGTSSSKKKDLADVLPPKLVKAMSKRSPPPDTSNETNGGSGSDTRRDLFQRGPPSQILLRRMESVGDITVDAMDELEMATAAIKTFEAFFVPEDDGAEEAEEDKDIKVLRNTLRDLSSRDLAMPLLEPMDGPRGRVGRASRSPPGIDVASAEGVLDSFMDALLMSLEKDLEAIENEMDEEETSGDYESGSGATMESRLRMKDSALTLFDVFQWSVDVNMRLPRPQRAFAERRRKPRRRASAFT